MLKFNLYLAALIICCSLACSSAKNEPLDIDFSKDSSSIRIKNIDPVGLLKIKNGELNDSVVQRMVQVVASPKEGDTSSQEQLVPGKIAADSLSLVFKPVKPFEKGKRYMVLTFINSKFGDLQSLIQSKTKFSMAPNQKILQR
jgi:hypothetical protein